MSKDNKKVGWLKRNYRYIILAGIDPFKVLHTARRLPRYLRNYREFRRQAALSPDIPFTRGEPFPCLFDRGVRSGTVSGAYFHQDLLVAQRVFARNPAKHVDIASRVDGLVAHIASFRPVEVVDIRALADNIRNIRFLQADFTAEGFPLANYCDSVSCLHALEHFGLGRYGDPVDFDGYLQGFRNLHRILTDSGVCYLSVPIGPQRYEFDGHRIFSVAYLLGLFEGLFRVDRFSYVDDGGDLHESVPLDPGPVGANFGCEFGCGIFELIKLPAPTEGRAS